jgi:hypothetical protein
MREQDIIIALVILAFSGLSAWLQKKRQAREQGQLDQSLPPTPRPNAHKSAPPPSEPKLDWEEQLRRLLEGDKPLRPREMMPPVLEKPARPMPPPIPEGAPVEGTPSETGGFQRANVQLSEAEEVYKRAVQVSETLPIHPRQSDEATEPARRFALTSGRSQRVVSPLAATAIAQLRTRQSVQQAFITATILGPPKAFASSPEN